jgi:hypothetical protein
MGIVVGELVGVEVGVGVGALVGMDVGADVGAAQPTPQLGTTEEAVGMPPWVTIMPIELTEEPGKREPKLLATWEVLSQFHDWEMMLPKGRDTSTTARVNEQLPVFVMVKSYI